MMFFVYTYILNQHHNFVNSFIYKLQINCIFIQIDTTKFVADKQKKPQTKGLRLRKHSGRGRRIRTLGTRFWRPLLYQLSYTPKKTLERRVPIYHTESPPVCQAFSPNKNVCSAPGAGILPCVQCASSLWQPVRMARRGICAVQMPLRAEKACLHHTLCHKYSTASKTRPRLPFCRCFLLFCEKMRRKG